MDSPGRHWAPMISLGLHWNSINIAERQLWMKILVQGHLLLRVRLRNPYDGIVPIIWNISILPDLLSLIFLDVLCFPHILLLFASSTAPIFDKHTHLIYCTMQILVQGHPLRRNPYDVIPTILDSTTPPGRPMLSTCKLPFFHSHPPERQFGKHASDTLYNPYILVLPILPMPRKESQT